MNRRQTRAHRARRIAQTPRAFANWPRVLTDLTLGRLRRGPRSLTFRTRSGITIDTPNRPGARVPVYEIFAEDCYRLERFLGPLASRPVQVLDIGGHVGTFTCRITQLNPDALVLAYEPSATSAAYLRRNVERNGVGDRVRVEQCALAGTTGTATFTDNGGGSGLNALHTARRVDGSATVVRTLSFDAAVASAPAPVEVVKMDCEGGEYDLVLNSSPESWASVQRVVLEYHPVSGHDWSELRDWFFGVGLIVQAADEVPGYGCVWLSRTPVDLG